MNQESRYFSDIELMEPPLCNSGVILQARMGSLRLPGKMLMDVCGKPLLGRVIERLSTLLGRDRVFVATTILSNDDQLVEYINSIGIAVFRGDSEDVLSRYIGAAKEFGISDYIIRATGDDPLTAVDELAAALKKHMVNGSDYTRLLYLPIGAQEEIVNLDALIKISSQELQAYHRQHVIDYILENKECFSVYLHKPKKSRIREDLRFTVDEAQDLKVVRMIINALGTEADLDEIIMFLDKNPEIKKINSKVYKKKLGEI